MMKDRIAFLKGAFERSGISLSEEQADQFVRYYELLIERNRVMNLTAITEWEEVVYKHFLDSCMLGSVLQNMAIRKEPFQVPLKSLKAATGSPDFQSGANVSLIDVGTGAGFPGIPLKLAYPSLEVTLLDSLNKRVGFLNEVISELGLDGIEAVHGRAEDFGQDASYRERYDIAVSRAVAKMTLLSEICLPFVKEGGIFAAYKTADSKEECEDAERTVGILGGDGTRIRCESYPIEGFDIPRVIYLINKIAPTPAKYPRRPGMIEKRPI